MFSDNTMCLYYFSALYMLTSLQAFTLQILSVWPVIS